MNDLITDESGETSFSELLEAYGDAADEAPRIGDKVTGAIISIGQDTVFLDTGAKMDAAVQKDELLDENGNFPHAIGDKLELYVVSASEHEIMLSKALSGIGGLESLREAHHNKVPVQGKVSGTCKGGFNIEMMHRRAFCPISQIDVNYTETPEALVGQTFDFLITQFAENGKNIVVSRRRLLEAQIAENRARFMVDLAEGQQMEATVTRLMPYGAFVELSAGVEGMVHISELSWSRIDKPDEAVMVGQKIPVQIMRIEDTGKPDRQKIALSVKQIQNDPWLSVGDRFATGQILPGKVMRLADFGAFVEIAPGIEGLVHISEMSFIKRVVKAEDIVAVGQTIDVSIKEIDANRRRISLSIREAEGDPWQDAADLFSPGKQITGTLAKKAPFGYFFDLAPGITGLVPKSKFKSEGGASLEHARIGGKQALTVIDMDIKARRITLAPGHTADESGWKDFVQKNPDPPMSDLAAKLQQALAAKNRAG